MKTKAILSIFLFFVVLIAGCNNNDDVKALSAFETALNERYPDATKVEWEKKKDWTVADFYWKGGAYEVWYNSEATWLMTVREDVFYNDFPQAVKASFEAGEYAGWKIDDVEIIELKDQPTLYLIEVEQGKAEYDLYYQENGSLAKVIEDNTKEHWKHMTAFFQ